jgi:15-cis-phytoene synthase
MELYTTVSYEVSRHITQKYSTSFGVSTRLFSSDIKPHIYAIYGLVRVADEIIDTYRGNDAPKLLQALESEVYEALERGFSASPVVHAFGETARQYGITKQLIRPFFESMAMDEKQIVYTQAKYERYIYGSAEVVGLMCLRVFLSGDDTEYDRLSDGARALGAAYQKVNFLRDLAADYRELGRIYFPGVTFDSFDDAEKRKIITDIEKDFAQAKAAVIELPLSSRRAVALSVIYYEALLSKIKNTPATLIKQKRIRINNRNKMLLYGRAKFSKVGKL